MGLVECAGNIVRMPYAAGSMAVKSGKYVVGKYLETVLQVPPKEELVDELRAADFTNDLEQATTTYELGRARRDPELGFLGGGWLVKLMCKADKDPKIPDQKVEEIARYIAEEQLDPMLEPLVDDGDAVHATELLDKYNPVTEVFFSRPK